MKIRKGDTVMVMTGKDRGKTGKVLRVVPKQARLLVEGVALQTRHRRPRKANEKGQRVSIPGLISSSNVRIICSSCNKPARIGLQASGTTKQRICKRCGATVA